MLQIYLILSFIVSLKYVFLFYVAGKKPSFTQKCHERNVSMSCQVQKFQYFFTLEISRFSRWQIYKENDPHGEWILMARFRFEFVCWWNNHGRARGLIIAVLATHRHRIDTLLSRLRRVSSESWLVVRVVPRTWHLRGNKIIFLNVQKRRERRQIGARRFREKQVDRRR